MQHMTKATGSRAAHSSPPPALTVRFRVGPGRAVISLDGEIDLATAGRVRDALSECHRAGATTLAVDVTGVTFCGVTGLNVFLAADRRATAGGGSLQLLHPSRSLLRVLAITETTWLLFSDRPSDHTTRAAGRPGNLLSPTRPLTSATAGG